MAIMTSLCLKPTENCCWIDFHENHRMSGAVDDIVLHANGARVGPLNGNYRDCRAGTCPQMRAQGGKPPYPASLLSLHDEKPLSPCLQCRRPGCCAPVLWRRAG